MAVVAEIEKDGVLLCYLLYLIIRRYTDIGYKICVYRVWGVGWGVVVVRCVRWRLCVFLSFFGVYLMGGVAYMVEKTYRVSSVIIHQQEEKRVVGCGLVVGVAFFLLLLLLIIIITLLWIVGGCVT